MHNLLIISCSQSKIEDRGLIYASQRYTGPYFNIINKAMHEDKFPADTDILILSAKYGIVQWRTIIPYYELMLTEEAIPELKARVEGQLYAFFSSRHYTYSEIFINMSKLYRQVIDDFDFEKKANTVVYGTGGIVKQCSQLKNWIHNTD